MKMLLAKAVNQTLNYILAPLSRLSVPVTALPFSSRVFKRWFIENWCAKYIGS